MKKKWIYVGAAVAAFLVTFGILFFNRHSISTAIKTQRADQHIENAIAAQEASKDSVAQRLARAGYALDPGRIDALRILLTTRTDKSANQILKVANSTFIHPDATPDDRSRCLGVYLEVRDFRLFRSRFETLPQSEKQRPDNQYLLAGYFAGQNLAEAALQILNQGPKDDLRFTMLRTTLRSLSKNESERKAGQRKLAELLNKLDIKISLSAFRQIRHIPPDQIEIEILKPAADKWITFVGNSRLSITDHLIINTLECLAVGETDSPGRAVVAQEAIAEHGSSHPVAVAHWLNRMQLWDLTVEFAQTVTNSLGEENDDLLIKQALFNTQLQALEAQECWGEQLALLNAPPSGIPPLTLALYRATAAKKLKKKTEADRYWQDAWRSAELESQRRNAYLDIYQWAKRTGELDQATQALIEASQSEVGMLPPTKEMSDFMAYLAENDKKEELATLATSIIRRETFSAPLVNNAIYLTELTGHQIPAAETLIKHMSARSPDLIAFQTNLILLKVNREQISEAYTIARRISDRVDVKSLPPTESVIIAGAYRLAGMVNEEAEIDLDKKLATLMGVERRLFESWLAGSHSPAIEPPSR